jgi:hypothetical protein
MEDVVLRLHVVREVQLGCGAFTIAAGQPKGFGRPHPESSTVGQETSSYGTPTLEIFWKANHYGLKPERKDEDLRH